MTGLTPLGTRNRFPFMGGANGKSAPSSCEKKKEWMKKGTSLSNEEHLSTVKWTLTFGGSKMLLSEEKRRTLKKAPSASKYTSSSHTWQQTERWAIKNCQPVSGLNSFRPKLLFYIQHMQCDLLTKKSSKAARISPASSPTREMSYHRSLGAGGSCPCSLTSGVTTQRPMNSSLP